jgi:predicted transcriptional regulator
MQPPADRALAHALRQVRRDRGSTQEEVAYRAGVTVAALARIERGEADPRWSTVMRVLVALKISPAELVAAIDDAPPLVAS